MRRLRALFAASLAMALWWGGGTPAHAQVNWGDEDSVKASFVRNFAQYADWPASVAASPVLRVCSTSQRPLDGHLALLQGRRIHERGIEVVTGVPRSEWTTCHVMFVGGDDAESINAALRDLAASPVLLIGDAPGFAARGGMIGLKRVAQRLRFDVNLAAANRAGIRVSSHVLRLADRVIQ